MKFNRKNLTGALVLAIFSFIVLWSAYFFCAKLAVRPVYDFFIKVTSQTKISDDIVIVTIDDQSINKIGRWPWKRNYYADIFEYLENVAGARVIALDSVIASEWDRADDAEFFDRLSKLKKVIPGVFFSKKEAFFYFEEDDNLSRVFRDKFSIPVQDSRVEGIRKQSEYKSCSYSIKGVMDSVKKIGSVLSHPDDDGIIRKAEHVFYYKNHYYPSLALAVMEELYPETKIVMDNGSLKINDFPVPLEDGRFSYIKWYRSQPFKTISAWKIIQNHDISPEVFKDKIVVVGTTSTALKDIKSTPLKVDYPGVFIQATLIDNFLQRDFMKKLPKSVEIAILFAVLAVSSAVIILLPPLYSAIILFIIGLGYFYACMFFAYPNSVALDPITPVVFIICVMLLGYGYEYFIEDDKRRKTRNLIAKYVSKDIMETILADIDGTKLGGKRADISVLFVDIRNFTHISETLPPEEVSELLNDYFSQMIPIIFKYKGTVNKFVGDALLVIFGAPVENTEHPYLAVKCAIEMLEKVEEMPDINVGIGISSGEAFVGNIGSDERFEYTAIGNTVNVASRLETFNKIYKTSVLISESTYERVKDFVRVQEVDSVAVTQNSEPIRIFELKDLKP